MLVRYLITASASSSSGRTNPRSMTQIPASPSSPGAPAPASKIAAVSLSYPQPGPCTSRARSRLLLPPLRVILRHETNHSRMNSRTQMKSPKLELSTPRVATHPETSRESFFFDLILSTPIWFRHAERPNQAQFPVLFCKVLRKR